MSLVGHACLTAKCNGPATSELPKHVLEENIFENIDHDFIDKWFTHMVTHVFSHTYLQATVSLA